MKASTRNVERLDFNEPPPSYFAQERAEWPERTADSRAAAWVYYRRRHDPPGLWSGFIGTADFGFLPRMGLDAGRELTIERRSYKDSEEAKLVGRAAAWAWYEGRLLLDELIRLRYAELGLTSVPVLVEVPRPTRWSAIFGVVADHEGMIREFRAAVLVAAQRIAAELVAEFKLFAAGVPAGQAGA